MYQRTLFALSLALLGGLTSCGDDNNDPSPATNKSALLTAKSWRVTADQSVVVSGGTTVTNDDFADLRACEKDDLIRFNADKTITQDQGASKCPDTSADPQTQKDGNWDFNGDQTKLTMADGSLAVVADVLELSATTLKIKFSFTDDGDSYTQTTTYTAQ